MERPDEGVRPDRVGEFVSAYAGGLERAFPDLFFDWHPAADALTVQIRSRYGTSTRVHAGYPLDLAPVFAAARRHMERDTQREHVAESLETAAWVGRADGPAGHLTYILRWLVHPQEAEVVFGDHPDVEPVLQSPGSAVMRTPTRVLKLWHDGAAVMHDARTRLPGGEYAESRGFDLSRTSLPEFQALWLANDLGTSGSEQPQLPPSATATRWEAAALALLREYDGAALLRHHLLRKPRTTSDRVHLDWRAANRLSVTHTEATLQDRAVLAIACHLSDRVEPLVSLPDALHYVGAARWDVMKALDGLAGRHPDPGSTWPVDCPTCR